MRRWTAVFLTMVLACLVFTVPALPEEIKEWICPQCGREGNTNKFCGACGYAWPGPGSDTTFDLANLKVGDPFLFGSYEQDNDQSNGKEDIRWIVLDINENSVLLISELCLNNIQYHEKFTGTTWEESSVRGWLKRNFITDAFTEEEQGLLLSRHNDNLPGNATEDQVFLLSEEEVKKYLPENQDRIAAATPYAIARGAATDDSHTTADGSPATKWWLRDGRYSSGDSDYMITVETDGHVTVGIKNNNKHTAVRPAILLKR